MGYLIDEQGQQTHNTSLIGHQSAQFSYLCPSGKRMFQNNGFVPVGPGR